MCPTLGIKTLALRLKPVRMYFNEKINHIRRQRLVTLSILGMIICSLLIAFFLLWEQNETIVIEEVKLDNHRKIKSLLYKKFRRTYLWWAVRGCSSLKGRPRAPLNFIHMWSWFAGLTDKARIWLAKRKLAKLSRFISLKLNMPFTHESQRNFENDFLFWFL